ncbi:Rrf2 family transcriptional regulator [Cetobacterium sp.]|uniref:Rrf2 family transcriptional regulator n=1 Tax=Cetobacterium sp. TaxID=2071632 RepID=UPI003F3C4EC5
MFSKQLQYSYLMYMLLRENSDRYLLSDEIVETTNVPKRWGRRLLSNMVSKKLIISVKGKGFCFLRKKITFWDFYVLIEEGTIKCKEVNNIIKSKTEQDYDNILLRIGTNVQEQMKNIKV